LVEKIVSAGPGHSQAAGRFKRKEHLKGRDAIKEVYVRGRRFSCRGAKLFVQKNSLPYNRICFTFSRGFGKAVERNRARRLGREVYRMIKPRLNYGYDMILLVYPDVAGVTFTGRMEQVTTLLSKAGLLQ